MMQITNKELRKMLGLGHHQRAWHSVQVVRLKDGLSQRPVLVVSEVSQT